MSMLALLENKWLRRATLVAAWLLALKLASFIY